MKEKKDYIPCGIELLNKRTPNEKHFLNEDGTITAYLYKENIHYLEDGEYKEIDNTLDDYDEYYENRKNAFKVRFDKTNNKVNIGFKNHPLDMKFKNCKCKRINKLEDYITYNDILDNIDVDYQLNSNKLKESIILKDRSSIEENIVFNLNTNLNLILGEEGCINAYENDELIYKIEKPYMFDSNNCYNDNIYYELIKVEEGYELFLFLDKEWLNNEERVYPVIVDPTIIGSETEAIEDITIHSGDASVNNNSGSNGDKLKVGVENNVINRSLIKFNLPTLGTASNVVDATAWLTGYPDMSFSSNINEYIIDVHEVTSNWTEANAKWNTMNDKFNSRVEDITFGKRSWGNSVPYYTPVNLTNLVKKWYSGKTNNGIMLKAQKEVPLIDGKIAQFCSKNTGVAPTLAITYRNINGLEDYMSYQTQSYRYGQSYVNNYNGNLTTIFSLGNTIGAKIPAELDLIYNTNDVIINSNFELPKGYKFNYYQIIGEVTISSVNLLEYLDSDSTIHYFKENTDDNVYYDEDGLSLSAVKQGQDYLMKDKNGNEMLFVKNGTKWFLTKIKDLDQNTVQIIYTNGKITKIIDSESNEVNITYSSNQIAVITPNKTNTINLNNNKIVSINVNGDTTTFVYNNLDLIDKILDVSGMSTKFDYISSVPYKISKVIQYGLNNEEGTSIRLDYGFNTTSVTDNKDRVNTYTFNNNGVTKSTTSLKQNEDIKIAYGKSNEYGENNAASNYTNKLSVDRSLIKHVNNLILNPSFESDTNIFGNAPLNRITETHSHTGNRSLKIVSSPDVTNLTETIVVPVGKSYTFSLYAKKELSGIGSISLKFKNKYNQDIIEKTLFGDSDEFERYQVSIYIDSNDVTASNVAIELKISIDAFSNFYIDDLQFEESETANYFNLVENSNFSSGFNTWDIYSQTFEVSAPTINFQMPNWNAISFDTDDGGEIVTLPNGNNALKINSMFNKFIRLRKRIAIKGKAGDRYNVSFWYKNEGATSEPELINPGTGQHPIFSGLYFDSRDFLPPGLGWGWTPEFFRLEFTPNDTEWQFHSYTVTAMMDYSAIEFELATHSTANPFYVTNLSIFKDLDDNQFFYDSDGNVKIEKLANGVLNQYAYDKNNQLMSITDSNGNYYKFEYDNNVTDRVLSNSTLNGITNKIKYDEFGNPIRNKIISAEDTDNMYYIRLKGSNKYLKGDFIDKDIEAKENDCSNQRWILEISDETCKIKSALYRNLYLAISNNLLQLSSYMPAIFRMVNNENGSISFQQQNTSNHLIIENDVLHFSNEEIGEFYLESAKNDLFIESGSKYTSDGRFLEKSIDSLGNITTYNIDTNIGLTNSIEDPNGNLINYTYDSKDRISKVEKNNQEVEYEYNNQNLLSKISHGTKEYNFTYDNFLNAKTVSIGNNKLIENSYEPNNGNLINSEYSNGQAINYTYDEFDRIKTINKQDTNYNYIYDNLNRISKITSNNEEINYEYDFKKRLNSFRNGDFSINYSYGNNNNVVKKEVRLYPSNALTTNYEYRLDNSIEKITLDNNDEVNYQYDYLGRLIKQDINGISKTKYGYVTKGDKTSTIVNKVIENDNTYDYKYDKLNNITHIYLNNELINEYFYDEYNQLVKEKNYDTNEIIEYVYDFVGNILSKTYKDLDSGFIKKEDTYNYNNSTWEDQLSSYNNETITYDQVGNPLTIGNDISLVWQNGRQLANYYDSSKNLNVSYTYNSEGIRTSKIVNNYQTKYHIEGSKIIFEEKSGNMIYYRYDTEGNLLGFNYLNADYFYVKNLQNDIIGIMDSNYCKLVNYKYDSWGKVISITDNNGVDIFSNTSHIGNINSFRYRSYYYDIENELYYLNSRYYNPKWGRFLNCDMGISKVGEKILGYNLYQYAFNNPINFQDYDGEWPKWLKTVAIVTAVVVVVAALTVLTAGTGTAAAVIAGGVVKGAAVGAAIGAASGAAISAVSHVASTGSTKGVGQAALTGATSGAVKGAAGGALFGGISSAIQVAQAANAWNAGTFNSNFNSMNYHYSKHVLKEGGNAKNIIDYTNQALNFANKNASSLKYMKNYNYGNASWNSIYTAGQGGEFTSLGKIITFWFK